MTKIDLKILELIEILKSKGTIRFEQDFCDQSGVLRQSLYRIKKGLAHFTTEHLKSICKVYNVNIYWVFEFEKNPFRTSKIAKIKEFQH